MNVNITSCLINNYWIMLISCHEPHQANKPSILVRSHQSDLSRLGGSSQPGGQLTPLCNMHKETISRVTWLFLRVTFTFRRIKRTQRLKFKLIAR